jgi:hypothetical protein
MIPTYIKEMKTNDLKNEIRLYGKILNNTRGAVSRPGDDGHEDLLKEYRFFQEELSFRVK